MRNTPGLPYPKHHMTPQQNHLNSVHFWSLAYANIFNDVGMTAGAAVQAQKHAVNDQKCIINIIIMCVLAEMPF